MSRRVTVLLGLAGSVLLTLAGPRLAVAGVTRWWFSPRLGSHAVQEVALYAGVVAVAAAWLALGRERLSVRQLWAIGALWSVPLVLGAPLFSHDAYSYLAQGTLVHRGIDPYSHAPVALGHGRVLAAVDPFWRHTTAPYGPLYLLLVSAVVAVTGSHLVAGVLVLRLFDLAGVALAAGLLPRLARALGADPARATWLAILSPLVLLQLIAPAHNDALMIGLLVAGLTLAVERRPLLGIAVCAVAATIKAPGAVGAVMIAVAWARAQGSEVDRSRGRHPIAGWGRALGTAVLVFTAVLAVVAAVSGLGLGWISSALFTTPSKVRLAITPATALGYTVASLLHSAGVAVGARHLEAIFGTVAFAAAAAFCAALTSRARYPNQVRLAALALLAIAIGGPAAWPWYLCWGLTLVAVSPAAQRSRLLGVGIAIAALPIRPDGRLALPLHTAPIVTGVYVALLAAALYMLGRGSVRRSADRSAGASVLAGS